MQTYRQYCPVAKAHEVLGDRWTMLIVRELIAGHATFNDIARGLPGIPRSTLSGRLRRLEAGGAIERLPLPARGYRYALTAAGRDLRAVVTAMGRWGATWILDAPHEEELDPGLLLWKMQHRLKAEALPRERVTIAFDFRIGRKGRFWFVIDDGAASVCLTDPGFETGLTVTADRAAFLQVWLGKLPLRRALADGLIRIEGRPAYERGFADWFLWSPFAGFISTELARADPA